MMKKFTLRDYIAETKAEYRRRYSKLDWRFTDEGCHMPFRIITAASVL